MTYRGYLPGLRPWVICDDCGIGVTVWEGHIPPRWLFDAEAPSGWLRIRRQTDEGARWRHYCPRCRGGHTEEDAS